MNQPNATYHREPIVPPSHIRYAHGHGRGMLTFWQAEQLVLAIKDEYVERKQGMTYLAQHQARAEMNRIFGYGNWDMIEDDPVTLYEEQRPGTGNKVDKMYWIVGKQMKVTIHVRDLWGMPIATLTGTHAEENAPLPNRGEAHGMALTSVASYALRRALINLGDRFGLGLYNGGSLAQHGQYTALLEPGQLFEWKLDGAQPQQAVATPQQPSHQTIQAEPAVVEQAMPEDPGIPSDYDDAEPDGQGGVRSRTHAAKMNAFHQAQAAQQAAREASRQQGTYPTDTMASRLQAGMKVDERGPVTGHGHPTDGPNMTAQQYAQEND